MFSGLLPKGSLRAIVAHNTASQLIGRAVSSVAIMVVSFLIARRYGPVGYGDFVKITTYVGFFYLLADYGLNAIFVRRAVENGDSPSATGEWRVLWGLRLTMSVVLLMAALGILMLLPSESGQGYTPLVRTGILLLLPVIAFQATTTTVNAYFQKILRYDLSTHAQNAGSVGMLVLAVILSVYTTIGGPLLGVSAVMTGSIVTAVTGLMLLRRHMRSVSPRFTTEEFFRYFMTASPLGLALIFNLVYFHSDSVILAISRPTQEVGIYGLAYKVFELPLVLPIFFMNSVYPLMLRGSGSTPERTRTLFTGSFQFLLASSLSITAVLWIAAPLIAFVRADFAASIEPLRVLLLGLPIFFLSALYMWVLIAEGRQNVLLFIHGIAMVVNIICNALLVPVYGYMAAAWLTVVSELLVLSVSAMVVRFAEKKGEQE